VSRRTIDRMVAAGTAPPVTRLPSGRRRRPRATCACGSPSAACPS